MITKTIIEECRKLYPEAKSDKQAVDLAAQSTFRQLKEKQDEYQALSAIRRELEEDDINSSEFKVIKNG